MGLVLFTNSWVTVNEANTYLSNKFLADGWVTLTSKQKEQVLITAFWWIYNYPSFSIAKTSTNEKVKNAQIELAWWTFNYYQEFRDREALISSGVNSFALSKWSESLGSQDLPKSILDMLSDFSIYDGGFFPEVERILH